MRRKDYAADYQATVQANWVSDLSLLWLPFRDAVIAAFQEGDTVAKDIEAAGNQFSAAVLDYVERGVELDISDYLQSDDAADNPVCAMMSAADNPDRRPETKDTKVGRVLSASNHAKIKAAADGIKDHVATIHGVLKQATPSARQNALLGYRVYGSEDPVPEQKDALTDLALQLSLQNAARGLTP